MIFSCKTTEAFAFKLLINFLESSFEGFSLEIKEKELTICQTDINSNILVEVALQAENFEYYLCTRDITIGLNLHNLGVLIKAIKKDDEITLSISKDNPEKLDIVVSGQNNIMGSIMEQIRQRIFVISPRGYSKPCIVDSTKFQKACKGQKIITLTSMGDYNMSVNNTIEFINYPETPGNKSQISINEHQILKLSKLTGMSNKLKIFLKEDLPMLVKANVGSLGTINVYIKRIERCSTSVHGHYELRHCR